MGEISDEDIESVKRSEVKRDFRHGMRGESARRCVGRIYKNCDIFGLTKGDFSKIDMLRHLLTEIGPCHIDIGTWTAASADISKAYDLLDHNNILSMRWLVDRSFPSRQKNYYEVLIKKFGEENIRLARFHAKFLILENEEYKLAVRTSMNLNMNKRIEFYEITEGSKINDYLRGIVDYHFEKPKDDNWQNYKNLDVADKKTDEHVNNINKLGNW